MRTAAQAVAAARASKSNRPENCLRWCWTIYGEPAPRVARWGSAADAWDLSKYRHTSHWTEAPVGALIFLGARPGNSKGDIFPKTGPVNEAYASDMGRMGHPGPTTVEARMKMTNRPYVGWLGDVLGNPIDFGMHAAVVRVKPLVKVKKEDDMPQRIPHTITRTTPQPVEKAWDWLRWNDAGDVSIVVDKAIAAPTVYLQLHGLPAGHHVLARFFRSNPKNPKRDHPYPEVTIIGTPGDTFWHLSGNVELADGDRLRVKLIAFDDGVTVAGGYGSTLVWK